ncbi:MAG: hypothetical protein IPN91_13700 [Holophagaceae bacterium]|uniref:Uncharacterized protein n=1 Tax=Candidatus Geothrix odensensis TaxID=2954440 RepID=A0A936F5U6_9BACT|nr:hypothetical protein [Candidatus Geothrix odensensis]
MSASAASWAPAKPAICLPAEGILHLRVVARSTSGMNTTPSQPLVRTP